MLPKIIKNWNVIIEGRNFAGIAEEVELPTLERAMEDYRGGGMLGPVKQDLGMSGMECSFTLGEFNGDILRAWGVFGAAQLPVRFLAAARADADEAPNDAIEIAMRGRWQSLEPGTAKGGEMAKLKVTMPLSYLRYSVNGERLLEIDLIAGTEIVGGEDRQAEVRRALGLTS
jgi:P2 family phage contractile tail tube protein